MEKESSSVTLAQNASTANPVPSNTTDLVRHPTATSNSARPQDPHLEPVISRTQTATKPPSFSRAHELAFIATIISAQFLTQSCLAQSIAPLHVIGASFGTPTAGQLSWLPAAFSLTVGTFILPAGRWGDLFGHKLLFVIGYAWFSVWSLVAGFSIWSRSLPFFAFCRAMQGIGCAVILPNGIAVLARTYPPGPKKEMVIAMFGAAAPVGYIVGAVFSGIFAQLVWWPWAYWVLGIVLAMIGLAAGFVVPNMPVAGGEMKKGELDLRGTTLGVAGLVLFNFAWNEGAATGWQKVYVYLLLIAGVFLMVVFVQFEKMKAGHPLLLTTAFTRDTNLVFGCIAAGWASFGIWMYYYWQFLEILEGNSILLAAAKNSPAAICGCIAAILTGYLIGRIQPGFIMFMAMCAFLTGTVLLATAPPSQTYWAQFFVATLIISFGMDMSFPSGVIVLSNHMPPEQQGIAASLVNTVVNYSISIGLGIAGTVETQVNKGGHNLLAGYRGAWYVGIGLDGLGLFLACCLIVSWRATMKARQKEKTMEIADDSA